MFHDFWTCFYCTRTSPFAFAEPKQAANLLAEEKHKMQINCAHICIGSSCCGKKTKDIKFKFLQAAFDHGAQQENAATSRADSEPSFCFFIDMIVTAKRHQDVLKSLVSACFPEGLDPKFPTPLFLSTPVAQ